MGKSFLEPVFQNHKMCLSVMAFGKALELELDQGYNSLIW